MKNKELLFDKHYPALDLLRVIAITSVMLQHFIERAYPLPDGLLKTAAMQGSYGVELFFALSGFLIGGQIMERLSTDRFSFKEFYIKRVFRIFPPYYASLIVALALYFTGTAYLVQFAVEADQPSVHIIQNLIIHLLYLQNYIYSLPGHYIFQAGIYWSLAVEEQFYLLAPVILYLLYRFNKRLLFAGLMVLIAAALATRSAIWSTYTGDEWWPNVFLRPFHTRFDALVFGILSAYLFLNYRAEFSRSTALKLILAFISIISLGSCFAYTGPQNSYFYSCVQFTMSGLGFSSLVLLLAVMPFRTYFEGFFRYIAKISYSMYLYHLMLITATHYLLVEVLGWEPEASCFNLIFIFSTYFALVVIASGITYYCVDKPFMAYRKKIVERLRKHEAVSAAGVPLA